MASGAMSSPVTLDACPANAISFGNLLDKRQSVVGRSKEIERNYDLLNYIGTRPRTSYLARVKNPNDKMPDAQFVGKATIHMAYLTHFTHGIHHPDRAGDRSRDQASGA